MQNTPIMPARRVAVATAIVLAAVLAAFLTAAARCPSGNARDAAACDAAHAIGIAAALCAKDAQRTETCADHETGIAHAAGLTRAASEWRKAAMAGAATPKSRRWLAHAMVLDERVQDDPAAPAAMRAQAKRDEELARTALLRTR
jgi:hypothetical protein